MLDTDAVPLGEIAGLRADPDVGSGSGVLLWQVGGRLWRHHGGDTGRTRHGGVGDGAGAYGGAAYWLRG